jgi:hypothetical protein
MTATQQRHQRSWRLTAAMHRTARALRYVNDELARANEAIFRPVGAPPPSSSAGTAASSATSGSGNAEAAAIGHGGRVA